MAGIAFKIAVILLNLQTALLNMTTGMLTAQQVCAILHSNTSAEHSSHLVT
jgi:hypothetical protein